MGIHINCSMHSHITKRVDPASVVNCVISLVRERPSLHMFVAAERCGQSEPTSASAEYILWGVCCQMSRVILGRQAQTTSSRACSTTDGSV